MKRTFTRTVAAVVVAAMLGSCAGNVTPETCQVSDTTGAGALIGGGIGLAAGGLAAGLSHQRGGAAAGIVAGAAILGAVIGTVIAHERDKACHQMALQRALDLAEEQNAELQQQQEAAAESAAQQSQQSEQQAPGSASVAKIALAPKRPPEPTPLPEYQTVAWANKMTNNSGAITPIAVTDAGAKQVCMTFDDTQTVHGQTKTVVGKACKGPNGDWQPL